MLLMFAGRRCRRTRSKTEGPDGRGRVAVTWAEESEPGVPFLLRAAMLYAWQDLATPTLRKNQKQPARLLLVTFSLLATR